MVLAYSSLLMEYRLPSFKTTTYYNMAISVCLLKLPNNKLQHHRELKEFVGRPLQGINRINLNKNNLLSDRA